MQLCFELELKFKKSNSKFTFYLANHDSNGFPFIENVIISDPIFGSVLVYDFLTPTLSPINFVHLFFINN